MNLKAACRILTSEQVVTSQIRHYAGAIGMHLLQYHQSHFHQVLIYQEWTTKELCQPYVLFRMGYMSTMFNSLTGEHAKLIMPFVKVAETITCFNGYVVTYLVEETIITYFGYVVTYIVVAETVMDKHCNFSKKLQAISWRSCTWFWFQENACNIFKISHLIICCDAKLNEPQFFLLVPMPLETWVCEFIQIYWNAR